jgi:hypothetical protein
MVHEKGCPGVFVITHHPHSVADFTLSFVALSQLESLLGAAHLGYLMDREKVVYGLKIADLKSWPWTRGVSLEASIGYCVAVFKGGHME